MHISAEPQVMDSYLGICCAFCYTLQRFMTLGTFSESWKLKPTPNTISRRNRNFWFDSVPVYYYCATHAPLCPDCYWERDEYSLRLARERTLTAWFTPHHGISPGPMLDTGIYFVLWCKIIYTKSLWNIYPWCMSCVSCQAVTWPRM